MADDEADDEPLDEDDLDGGGEIGDGDDGDGPGAEDDDDFGDDDGPDAEDDDDIGGGDDDFGGDFGDDDFDDDDFDDDDDDDDDEGGSGSGKKKWIIIGAAAFVVIAGAAGGTMMLFGGGDEPERAAAANPNAPRVTMAIPPKRRLKITSDDRPSGGQRARPKFGAKRDPGGSTKPKKLKAGPDPKPALTPPPPPAANSAAAGQASASGRPGSAASREVEVPAEPAKPASTGVRRTPGKGVITPSVTAVAFRGIPIQPRGKSLSGVNSEMIESTSAGLLPRKTSRGGAPWQEYARPFKKEVKRPRIAIIIKGVGLSRAATLAAINQLPGGITLAFSPYTNNLSDWMGMARSSGHETLIDLPMEPNDFPVSDPGPLAMLTELEAADNIRRLHRLLGLAPGFVGVFQVMGSKFAASEESLTPVLSELQKRGLLYVDSGVPKGGLGEKVAKSLALPRTGVTITLDTVASAAAINGRLTVLEKRARNKKFAVGAAEPYPVTIRLLAEWAKSLDFKGLTLAPVSAVVRIDGLDKKPGDGKPGDEKSGAEKSGADKPAAEAAAKN